MKCIGNYCAIIDLFKFKISLYDKIYYFAKNINLMNFLRKLGIANTLMLLLCILIIIVAEYLFLSGDKLHGIFIGLWAPTLLGVMIYLKLTNNERR